MGYDPRMAGQVFGDNYSSSEDEIESESDEPTLAAVAAPVDPDVEQAQIKHATGAGKTSDDQITEDDGVDSCPEKARLPNFTGTKKRCMYLLVFSPFRSADSARSSGLGFNRPGRFLERKRT